MPESRDFALIFGNRNSDDYMPTALVTSQAGAWAAERGEYRIAQQLMGLAAALQAAELEHQEGEHDRLATQIRAVPMLGATRNEQPRNYPIRSAAPDDTAVLEPVGSTAPRDCSTCGLLIVWERESERWLHTSPGNAFEVVGEHDPTLG
jgi:hypothetical protein